MLSATVAEQNLPKLSATRLSFMVSLLLGICWLAAGIAVQTPTAMLGSPVVAHGLSSVFYSTADGATNHW